MEVTVIKISNYIKLLYHKLPLISFFLIPLQPSFHSLQQKQTKHDSCALFWQMDGGKWRKNAGIGFFSPFAPAAFHSLSLSFSLKSNSRNDAFHANSYTHPFLSFLPVASERA